MTRGNGKTSNTGLNGQHAPRNLTKADRMAILAASHSRLCGAERQQRREANRRREIAHMEKIMLAYAKHGRRK